jgi:hypothetical protein
MLEERSIDEEFKVLPRLDELSLKQLALDIMESKVFTSLSLDEGSVHLVRSIFIPLIFLDQEYLYNIQDDLGMIYENYSKAGSWTINGFPMFVSCRFLNREDTKKVLEYLSVLEKQREEFMGDGDQ